jgi:hypothetical protein
MRFDRHAYMGRDDDREHQDLHARTKDPRAGYAPENGGGLDHDPTFYKVAPASTGGDGSSRDDYDVEDAGSVMRAPRHDPDAIATPGEKPKDARIYEAVKNAIEADDDVDVSQVFVAVKDGGVELRGLVEDREARRRVEELAWGVGGVVDVVNKLRLR